MEPKLPIDSDSSNTAKPAYIDAGEQFKKQFNLKNLRIDLIHDQAGKTHVVRLIHRAYFDIKLADEIIKGDIKKLNDYLSMQIKSGIKQIRESVQ